jgi:hypothetical protein
MKIISQNSPEGGHVDGRGSTPRPGKWPLTWRFAGGRCRDRTCDLFGVNEALSR